MAQKTKIKCPKCGAEYLPSEIYYPKEFLGRPREIFKDEKGFILSPVDSLETMNTYEEYECNYCGQLFGVEATISFKTTEVTNSFLEDDDFEIPEEEK